MLFIHIYKTRYLYTTLSKAQHDWFRVQSVFTQSEKIAKDYHLQRNRSCQKD